MKFKIQDIAIKGEVSGKLFCVHSYFIWSSLISELDVKSPADCEPLDSENKRNKKTEIVLCELCKPLTDEKNLKEHTLLYAEHASGLSVLSFKWPKDIIFTYVQPSIKCQWFVQGIGSTYMLNWIKAIENCKNKDAWTVIKNIDQNWREYLIKVTLLKI